jgi:hypothetical protein
MDDQRRQAAEKEAAERRATDARVLEDAERLIAAWNERQAKRMPMLFSPTIGAAITAGYWFLWVRCPACRTTFRLARNANCTNVFEMIMMKPNFAARYHRVGVGRLILL